jgi:protein-tyrosine phosphatase
MKSVINFRDIGNDRNTFLPLSGSEFQNRDTLHSFLKNDSIIKPGMIYRSAHLDNINRIDADKIRSLGIQTIVDLRSQNEIKKKDSLSEIKRLHLPINFDNEARQRLKPYLYKADSEETIVGIINSVYIEMIDAIKTLIPTLFQCLISPKSYPVLIHCRGGKDRTGIICCIIQLALGTNEDYIIKDYMLSNEGFLPVWKRKIEIMKFFTFGLMPVENFIIFATCKEKYIRSVINKINNEYFGIENFLAHCGISSSDINKLKEVLL